MLEEMGFAGCGREGLCEILKAEAGSWSFSGTSQSMECLRWFPPEGSLERAVEFLAT